MLALKLTSAEYAKIVEILAKANVENIVHELGPDDTLGPGFCLVLPTLWICDEELQ